MASVLVVGFYLVLFIVGMKIARSASDDFGRLLAHGLVCMIVIQALINFVVVTGCVPTKGLALPFISYGGSSILSSSIMLGILINIAIDAERSRGKKAKRLFKDRWRGV